MSYPDDLRDLIEQGPEGLSSWTDAGPINRTMKALLETLSDRTGLSAWTLVRLAAAPVLAGAVVWGLTLLLRAAQGVGQ